MMIKLEYFRDSDWDHMHDCVLDVKHENLNRQQLEEIFFNLPENLQREAQTFGMSDTAWRENFINYIS